MKNNQNGIALMMVLTAIVLLSAIMLSFSIDSSVNKIRTYNIEDKAQAKFTAESGLKFAMTRLKLYKDAFNYLQKNEGAQKVATQEMLNVLWSFPFVYPIPVSASMNQIQKDALADFEENTILKGQMRMSISNLSNKLNLNALRVALLNQKEDKQKVDADGNPISQDQGKAEYNLETQLMRNLQNSFEAKIESDEEFYARYSGVQFQELVEILKYYVSDEQMVAESAQARAAFMDLRQSAKHAPMTSFSEIYTLPQWDDELVKLIENEFIVHGAVMIDLNKITDKMLRLLIPSINEQEIKDFFEYKNNPEDPKFFNSLDDFKNYVTGVGNLMTSTDFDNMIKEFELNKIRFGVSPSLFKITSVGEVERASYTIEAYVIIPPKPAYKKPDPSETSSENPLAPQSPETDGQDTVETTPTKPTTPEEDTKKKAITYLMEPRIVEIYVK